MNIKTVAVQALSALLVAYQSPAVADGTIQGNILSCTYDLQRLEVTMGTSTSSADISTSSSGKGKSNRCAGRTPMPIAFFGNLPMGISAKFTDVNPDSPYYLDEVVCQGTVEAGATSVDINLLNHCTCSFGKPRPASCP